jgi:hypothetical protein
MRKFRVIYYDAHLYLLFGTTSKKYTMDIDAETTLGAMEMAEEILGDKWYVKTADLCSVM